MALPVQPPSWLVALCVFLRNCFMQCWARLVRSAPPNSDDLVSEFVLALGLSKLHLLQIYDTFRRLRQSESDSIVGVAFEIREESVTQLVVERQKWCSHLLRALLRLAGCEGTVTWDQFVYILLRFCSLNRVELAQALFLVIHMHLDSTKLTYLTREQLSTFYSFYGKKSCPASFSTRQISFERLPLSRYYVTDFAELAQRFGPLLNPMRHLQRLLQEKLPNLNFWDSYDFYGSFTRKITDEFFVAGKSRVYIRGDPPFRETCEFLVPDALGFEPINQDQWNLRAANFYQVSTWGHQLPPELADELPPDYIESTMTMHVRAEADHVGAHIIGAPQAAAQMPNGLPQQQPRGAQAGAAMPMPALMDRPPPPGPPLVPPPVGAGAGGAGPFAGPGAAPTLPTMPSLASQEQEAAPQQPAQAPGAELDPSALSLVAATTGEEDDPPIDILPPDWMKWATSAPAPRRRGPDPPVYAGRRRGGAGAGAAEAWGEQSPGAEGGSREDVPNATATSVKGFRVTFSDG